MTVYTRRRIHPVWALFAMPFYMLYGALWFAFWGCVLVVRASAYFLRRVVQ